MATVAELLQPVEADLDALLADLRNSLDQGRELATAMARHGAVQATQGEQPPMGPPQQGNAGSSQGSPPPAFSVNFFQQQRSGLLQLDLTQGQVAVAGAPHDAGRHPQAGVGFGL